MGNQHQMLKCQRKQIDIMWKRSYGFHFSNSWLIAVGVYSIR